MGKTMGGCPGIENQLLFAMVFSKEFGEMISRYYEHLHMESLFLDMLVKSQPLPKVSAV